MRVRLGIACLFLVPAVPVRGQQLPPEFTLGRYVPQDAWMVVHGVHNPDRAFIDQYWSQVWNAAMSIRIDRDLLMLLLHDASAEDQAKMLSQLDKAHDRLRRVSWNELVAKETMFAETPARGGLGYDYIFLARGAEGSGTKNFKAILDIVKEAVPIAEDTLKIGISMHHRTTAELDVLALGVTKGSDEQPHFGLFLVRRGDIIGAVVGGRSFDNVRRLLNRKGEAKSLLDNPRFVKAVAEVPPPSVTLTYFDFRAFMSDIRHMCDVITVSVKKGGTRTRIERGPDIVRHLMGELNVIDYTVSSVSMDGLHEIAHTVVRIQPERRSAPLARAVLDRKSFARFDQFVPEDATSYSNKGMVDFGLVYRFALDTIAKQVPDGAAWVKQLNETLAQIGFDPQADLFDWLGGEMVTVALPSKAPSATGSGEFVWFIRTKDPDLAWRKVNGLIDLANTQLQARGQALLVQPADVGQKRFRRVVHPMVAMFLQPVIGVYKDWLVIGSSDQAVRRCLAVSSGTAPSIAANERFRAEGLLPDGPVMASSFCDSRRMGDKLAQSMAMGGMVAAMLSGQLKGDAPPEALQLLAHCMTFGLKLSPVLRELDFYSSHASRTYFDGDTRIETVDQVTYLPPRRRPMPVHPTPPAPPKPQG